MSSSNGTLKSIRSFVASIPIVGPQARRMYGKFVRKPEVKRIEAPTPAAVAKPAPKPKPKPKPKARPEPVSLHNKPRRTVSLLKRTPLFDGAVTIANEEVAKHLYRALASAAKELAIIVFPTTTGNHIHLGLRELDIPRFTYILSTALETKVQWGLSLEKAGAQNASPEKWFEELRSKPRLLATLEWPGGLKTTLYLSLYFPDHEKTDSKDSLNSYLRHIHHTHEGILTTPGLIMATDILGGRPPGISATPVDVVYTWVNHEDPDWQRLYATARDLPEDTTAEAFSAARFTNRDELRYSIRSVEWYLPWVRKIHIFSNCAPPDWFKPSDRICWVRHEDVMPEHYLPTFNSHAIESFLHHIPDLADNFIYMNDDVFINEALRREYFFSGNDLSNSSLESYGVVNGESRPGDPDYLNAARNGVELMRKTFGTVPTQLHRHTPFALRKPVLANLEADFPDAIHRTRQAQFRTANDISIASFLFHHYAYQTGAGTQIGYRSQLVKHTTADVKGKLAALKEGNGVRVFCINDGGNSHNDEVWNDEVDNFLKTRFPIPTVHEKPDHH